MFRLTKPVDYGLGLLTFIAQEPETVANARELAERSHHPAPMVTKILKLLAREGLLESRRGVNGGYLLARSPATISVADIIRALEGPIALTACIVGEPGECEREDVCPVRGHVRVINTAIQGALAGITLQDLTRPATRQLFQLQASSGDNLALTR